MTTSRSNERRAVSRLLDGVATTLATIARPDTAASLWLNKKFTDNEESSQQHKRERDYVDKFVFLTLMSLPTHVVWGRIVGVVWREHLDGDIVVRHPHRGYQANVNFSNIGLSKFFDTEEKLQSYAADELKAGSLREGSFKLTYVGAVEIGKSILGAMVDSVKETPGDLADFEIPVDFAEVLHRAYEDYVRAAEDHSSWLLPRPIQDAVLYSKYPFEFAVISSVCDYAFNILRLAELSETK